MQTLRESMVGQRYGRWTITGLSTVTDSRGKANLVRCTCSCGTKKEVDAYTVRKGLSTSCGCLRAEVTSDRSATHRMTGTPEHQCWRNMLNRCTNPKVPLYHRYGGRGIKVCQRWREFENFLADMGPRPTPKSEIDRKDNNGNYCKANCRWTIDKVNARNKEVSLWFLFRGKRRHLKEICEMTSIKYTTAWRRLRKVGLPLALAIRPPA